MGEIINFLAGQRYRFNWANDKLV